MRDFFIKLQNKLLQYKKLFVKDEDQNTQENKPKKLKNITVSAKKESSVVYQNNKRFLALKNTDCAIVMHDNSQCEVIFTKFNKDNQEFTANEELLMALTIFLKQPGFGDMLISEFHRAAIINSNKLFENEENNKGDN